MSLDPELDDLFQHTVQVFHVTGHGEAGQTQIAVTAVPEQCHIRAMSVELVSDGNETRLSEAKVTFKRQLAIDEGAQLTFPSEFNIQNNRVKQVLPTTDDEGPHHTVVMV